jgi:A/G-specific adenine glycosylase
MFGEEIISWFKVNKRDLPWRNTRDPYKIWLSEIILQQTRVDQGLSYYYKFTEKFPDIKLLARANEDTVLKLWQGLGYYSRARNLHFAAKQVVNDFGGKFPDNYHDILSLKGVGEYTAAAIASFAYRLPHAVVDGNVYRFLSRYFGKDTPIDSSTGKKEFIALAQSLLDGNRPDMFNQAIMEFGAQQCKPGRPDCSKCPLVQSCIAFKEDSVLRLPVKKNSIKIRNRYFNYLVIKDNDSFFVKKRSGKDIWQGLHDFPVIETTNWVDQKKLLQSDEWNKEFGKAKIELLSVSDEYKHVLSHQHIYAKFYEIKSSLKTFSERQTEWQIVDRKKAKKLAVPKLIEMYLDELDKR